MEVTIITINKKLSPTILAQVEEATMKDMRFACEEGKVLGYVNPTGSNKHRVFLLTNEKGDLRKVTNYPWENAAEGTSVFAKLSKNLVQKSFKTLDGREEFRSLFKTIKTVAEATHIYI